jgi:hypothetical protein
VPDVAEHPFMQPPGKTIGEDVRVSAAEGPNLGLSYIVLFPAIQLGPRRDVGKQQAFSFIGVKRGWPPPGCPISWSQIPEIPGRLPHQFLNGCLQGGLLLRR